MKTQRFRSAKVTYVSPDLADVNTVNFIGLGAVHTKLMVVNMALDAPTNIPTTCDLHIR
jgi:hypothetical protein